LFLGVSTNPRSGVALWCCSTSSLIPCCTSLSPRLIRGLTRNAETHRHVQVLLRLVPYYFTCASSPHWQYHSPLLQTECEDRMYAFRTVFRQLRPVHFRLLPLLISDDLAISSKEHVYCNSIALHYLCTAPPRVVLFYVLSSPALALHCICLACNCPEAVYRHASAGRSR
jgi:hypothetical protein